MRPWCADLFGDADLLARCPAVSLASPEYPDGFFQLAQRAPPGPWIYTGALENRPALVKKLARQRPLWGNSVESLALARSPANAFEALKKAGIPCPAVQAATLDPPTGSRWLVKPLHGSGAVGIHHWSASKRTRNERTTYLQEYLDGQPSAALYVGDGRQARFLGLTRQLVGENWLHAAAFRYCGSIGGVEPTSELKLALERLGDVLTAACGLLGLFGVDGILREDVFWPVEINPRYTASVEVLEHALGLSLLAIHRAVFHSAAPTQDLLPAPTSAMVGKAILYARAPLRFPRDGPWLSTLQHPRPIEELPEFADIPRAGQVVERGRPVLSFFVRGANIADSTGALLEIASDLDRLLYRQ